MTIALDRLLGPGEIRRLAETIGLTPTKSLGQNFVHDGNTVRRLVEVSGIDEGDVVLEIGPGLGSLTLALLQAARSVIAVEVDPRLAALLPETARTHLGARATALTVIAADALRLRRGEVDAEPTTVVANLPYNVSVPVILHLLAEFPTIATMLVMVQSEVADRLVAGPGSRTYGAPSVKLAWYGEARRAGSVSRAIFWPVPRVDSALVAFRRSATGRDRAGTAQVFEVVDAAFAQRRKTLRSALARWAGSPASAARLCRNAGIDPSLRGEALGVTAFAALAAARGVASAEEAARREAPERAQP